MEQIILGSPLAFFYKRNELILVAVTFYQNWNSVVENKNITSLHQNFLCPLQDDGWMMGVWEFYFWVKPSGVAGYQPFSKRTTF